MKKEKRGIIKLLFIIGIISLFSISFVSAGWLKDILSFGNSGSNQEGELGAVKPVNVNLQVSGAYPAPSIVYISDLNGKNSVSPVNITAADRDLTDALKTKTVQVYVYSPAGVSALPASPTAAQVYVTLVYDSALTPKGQYNSENQRKSTTACTAMPNDLTYNSNSDELSDVNLGTNIAIRKYSCTVNMNNYDNYGSSTNKNWFIYAYIEDLSSPTPNKVGFDGTTTTGTMAVRKSYFNRLENYDVNPNLIDFGTVGYGVNLAKTPTSNPAITNKGNINISQTTLKGYNLPLSTDQTKIINSAWFSTDPATPCGSSNVLTSGTAKNTNIPVINYGSSVSRNLLICLNQVDATAPSGSYSTTNTGGISWEVDTTMCSAPITCP